MFIKASFLFSPTGFVCMLSYFCPPLKPYARHAFLIKTVGNRLFAGEGVDPLMHKQETPTAIVVEACSFILLCI